MIRSVAKDSLRLASPILEALRTGNLRLLQGVDDVVPLDVERYLQEAERSVTTVGRVDMLRKQTEKSSPATDESSLVGWLIEAGVPEIVARQAVESLESDGTTPLLDVSQNALEQDRKLMQATENPQDLPDKKTAEPAKKRTAKKQGTTNEGVVLKSIVQAGLKAGVSAYDALKKAEWIQSMEYKNIYSNIIK